SVAVTSASGHSSPTWRSSRHHRSSSSGSSSSITPQRTSAARTVRREGSTGRPSSDWPARPPRQRYSMTGPVPRGAGPHHMWAGGPDRYPTRTFLPPTERSAAQGREVPDVGAPGQVGHEHAEEGRLVGLHPGHVVIDRVPFDDEQEARRVLDPPQH